MHSAQWFVLGIGSLFATSAVAAPTDLTPWTREGPGNWIVAADKNSVTQTLNNPPTVFYSDFNGQGRRLSGTIRVNTRSDDDFIGFVLGFKPGDLTNATSDFIVVDWKQNNQTAAGCLGAVGLSISRASTGLGPNAGAWCHRAASGVTELARATTLGSTGWLDNTEYSFDIDFTASNIKVSVNGNLELNINGNFGDGRFGFYNFSQANVTYGAIQDDVIMPGVPEPATWGMMVMGFGFAGSAMRRRNQRVRRTAA